MVCLTSCVFRSIRFSGFARPHRLGCGARENYTRRRRRGARAGASVHETYTNRGILFIYACSSAREGRVHSGAAVPTPDAPQPRGPSCMRRRHGHGAGSSAHAGPEHLVLPPALPITQAARLPLWKTGRQCLTYILQAFKPAHQRRPFNWARRSAPEHNALPGATASQEKRGPGNQERSTCKQGLDENDRRH